MDLYAEIILDHYKNPRNFGEILADGVLKGEVTNPMCGDKLKVFLQLNENKIKNIKFIGEGCAISKAGMSLLSEELIDKEIGEVLKIGQKDIFNLIGVEVAPGRVKCAMLGIRGVKEALGKFVR